MINSASPTSSSTKKNPSQVKPANLFRRLAAMTYDFLLLTGLSFAYGAFGLLARSLIFPASVDTTASNGFAPPGIIFKLGWFFLIGLFFVFFWQRGGQTLGMRAWRIRVINTDGTNISVLQGIIRCCIAPLSLSLGGIGYVWCLFDKDGQTIHDKLSKSVAIQLEKEKKPEELKESKEKTKK